MVPARKSHPSLNEVRELFDRWWHDKRQGDPIPRPWTISNYLIPRPAYCIEVCLNRYSISSRNFRRAFTV